MKNESSRGGPYLMLILVASYVFGALNSQAEHIRRLLRNQGFIDSSIL